MTRTPRLFALFAVFGVFLPALARLPLSPEGTYDSAVPAPSSFLGRPLAEGPARAPEVLGYARLLAEKSGRARVVEMGKTYEGRPNFYVLLSDSGNLARID